MPLTDGENHTTNLIYGSWLITWTVLIGQSLLHVAHLGFNPSSDKYISHYPISVLPSVYGGFSSFLLHPIPDMWPCGSYDTLL